LTASVNAARAYAVAATRRSLREQEADVFRHASAVLRRARTGSAPAQARALADNDRLWTLVLDLVRDPDNALPGPLRAALASVGRVVQRELRADSPDIEFVVAINENIARGLAGAI
jgi:flagellar biosynthesis regulator FlaF